MRTLRRLLARFLRTLAALLHPEETLPAPAPAEPERPVAARHIARRERLPDKRSGYTMVARIGKEGSAKVIVRTGDYADGRLGEVFLDMRQNPSDEVRRSLLNCFAIAVSVGLQHGVPLDKFVDLFCRTRFNPSGLVTGATRVTYASSIIDLVFRELGIAYLGRHELAFEGDPVQMTPQRAQDG